MSWPDIPGRYPGGSRPQKRCIWARSWSGEARLGGDHSLLAWNAGSEFTRVGVGEQNRQTETGPA